MGSDAGAGFYPRQRVHSRRSAVQPVRHRPGQAAAANNLTSRWRAARSRQGRAFSSRASTRGSSSGALDGEFAARRAHDLLGREPQLGAQQCVAEGHNIFNARNLALALGDPARVRGASGLRAVQHLRRTGSDGTGSITPEMLAFTTFTQSDRANQQLNDVAANFSGELFDLPAGPFGYAFGYEYRKEPRLLHAGSVVQAGETADVPASPTAGEIESNEFYLELRAPLLADLPLVAAASSSRRRCGRPITRTSVAMRSSRAACTGVVPDFSVRASYSEGFRAPNIGELFNTGSRFDTNIYRSVRDENNPRSGARLRTVRRSACRARSHSPIRRSACRPAAI